MKEEVKPGYICMVKIGGRRVKTVIDEHGVQRLPSNPVYVALWESGALDLNKLALAVSTGKMPFDEYLEYYLNFGYSVSGFAELSRFQHLDIENPLWENYEG